MQAVVKIINNKKILMTEEEWVAFNNICRSYDRPNWKGEELFVDLFNSDDAGNITFINPPSTRYTSLEAYLFICSIYQHQSVRFYEKRIDTLVQKYENKLSDLTKKLEAVAK
jgi:hypothetical protein